MARGKPVPDSTGQIMTAAEVAELLHVHKTTLYRLIQQATFPTSELELTIVSPALRLTNGGGCRKFSARRPGYHDPSLIRRSGPRLTSHPPKLSRVVGV